MASTEFVQGIVLEKHATSRCKNSPSLITILKWHTEALERHKTEITQGYKKEPAFDMEFHIHTVIKFLPKSCSTLWTPHHRAVCVKLVQSIYLLLVEFY